MVKEKMILSKEMKKCSEGLRLSKITMLKLSQEFIYVDKAQGRQIIDKRYFARKVVQILVNPDGFNDTNSVQWRVLLVCCLENLLKTKFESTRDFKRKVGEYLKNFDGRRLPIGERIRKARKKLSWTQKQLADHLGFRRHVTISNYEKGLRYPPDKVFRWIEEQGE